MKTKTFRYLSVMMAALLLLIVEGCQQQTYEVVKPLPTELSMDAAKQYYEATKHRSKASTKYQFLWDLVKKIEIDGAPIITVPVVPAEGGNTILQIQKGQVSSSRVETGSAMFYLNGEGKITASITATELALTESLGKKPQKMYFFDWMDESLQSVWTFDNGIFVQVDKAVDNSRARTTVCTIEHYILVCNGAGQLGGGHQNPDWLPDPGEGCYWYYTGSTACGGGGGPPPTPPTPPITPAPPRPGYPGGGSGGGPNGPPNISPEAMTRIYVASKIGSWEAQGVNVTDEERDWFFSHPGSITPVDLFIKEQFAKATEKLAFGILGNMIRSLFDSDFEKRMFDRYWSGQGGTYTLTNAEFNDIIAQGRSVSARTPSNDPNNVVNGQATDVEIWDWYHTTKYNLALGRASVFFSRGGGNIPMGFRDGFNFNPGGEDGHRTWRDEALTLIGGTFTTFGARDFNIRYP